MKTAIRKNLKQPTIPRLDEDRIIKSEALQFPEGSPFREIAKAPRNRVSTLPEKQILEKTPPQQRLIAIIEQIAYKHAVKGQRGVSAVLNINQPSIRDYANAVLQDPLKMSPASFTTIAKFRGISELMLRAFLTGDGSLLRDGSEFSPDQWLEAIEGLDDQTLVEGLKLIISRVSNRVNGLMVERDSHLQRIEQLEKELSEVQVKLTYYDATESNGSGSSTKEPEFKLHPGNQRLIDALNDRQQLLGFEDEEWDEFCSNILRDWVDVWDWLQYNPLPIPNEYLTGGLPKILKRSAEELFKLRDQD